MNRRHALSIAVATTLSITGIGAAIGATTNIFSAADASDLGKISPVSSTTLAPVVDHVRVDVDDPAPVSAPTVPGPTAAPVRTSGESEHRGRRRPGSCARAASRSRTHAPRARARG